MITVHHLNNSRSQRILWLLEELAVPYTVHRYERDPETMLAPASLREIHPLGKSPVIDDDGTVIAETGAIIEYLVELYGSKLMPVPVDPRQRQRYRYCLHYAEGSLMPLLVMRLVFNRIRSAKMPFVVKPIAAKICDKVDTSMIAPHLPLHLAMLEAHLGSAHWFAGDQLSGADIQLSFPIEAAQAHALLDQHHPNLIGWLERIRARPAYQAALKRGGPYSYGA